MAVTLKPREKASHRTSVEDVELRLLLEGIAAETGFDFREYAPAVIKRRVQRAMHSERVTTISSLQDRVLHDEDVMARVVRMLVERKLQLFDDPAYYRRVRATVVPMLRTYPFARIWLPGCADGAEAFSLAIVLFEEGILHRCRMYATDAAADLVDQARTAMIEMRGPYMKDYLASGGRATLNAYLTPSGAFNEEIRRSVIFAQHNIVSDAVFNSFQFVVMRNVGAQFNPMLRSRVHRIAFESLVPLGYLALGVNERDDSPVGPRELREADRTAGLYRRAS
ncbi:MAG TPA: CheR family methyltransferase [Candidatus Eremiobacteraceae bacterium]|jgi:chemotaxis protein methyltransferase CheR